jgi:hypothetical protein
MWRGPASEVDSVVRQSLATSDGIFRRARLWSLSLPEALVTLPLAYGDRDIPAPSAPSQAGSRDPLVSEGSGGRIADVESGVRRGRDLFCASGEDPHLASPWEGEGLARWVGACGPNSRPHGERVEQWGRGTSLHSLGLVVRQAHHEALGTSALGEMVQQSRSSSSGLTRGDWAWGTMAKCRALGSSPRVTIGEVEGLGPLSRPSGEPVEPGGRGTQGSTRLAPGQARGRLSWFV